MSTPRDETRPEAGDAPAERLEGVDLDHECIQLAQRGDERAFESLVQRHQGRAFRVARNLVPSDEDARDLAQEAFLRVFRNLDRFDFQYPFTTWLNRIVTNLAIDHLRRRRPTARGAGGDVDDEAPALPEAVDESEPAPGRRLEAEETAQRVRDCIDSLAPHFQSVLTLRELEGLSCLEIADIVGATHVTVRWRLHRGRKLFAEEWQRRERLAESLAGKTPNDPPTAP
ncbi:MAG TPA: sigma-70 family RNA polymerase sigma factor [Planctomycetota bacterium]|nr:sigma-70 family RNA polymerase sigma factor [Planctomycetota bacterium]